MIYKKMDIHKIMIFHDNITDPKIASIPTLNSSPEIPILYGLNDC